jgi:hypothetical protein
MQTHSISVSDDSNVLWGVKENQIYLPRASLLPTNPEKANQVRSRHV